MRIISIVNVQTCFLHPSDVQLQELPLSLGYSRKNPPPLPTDGKLEILTGGGVEGSGNPGRRGGLDLKIRSLTLQNLFDRFEKKQ